ncbi:MAG TPA: glycoside hydrolase family 16 protein [Rariglobus sp.]|nr:glycoside hydrolase family 16 protein [Rariglobus sp.]
MQTLTYPHSWWYFIGSLLLLAMASICVGAAPDEAPRGWKLVWADEFNYQGLPDATKWGYEEGFVRNNETQYYTKARLENARVEQGNLVIECRKEHFKPHGHAPVEYTAASLITLGKASWKYGRIEVRAKLPIGSGVWPAIWTLGTNISKVDWPTCGEIDIMECIGREPDVIHGTVHYALKGEHQSEADVLKTDTPSAAFHIYAIEWDADKIDFYFDQTKYHTFLIDKAGKAENPFRAPHYLLLNFALGAWGGPVDDAILPRKFLIDYVRVYQRTAPCNAAPLN